MFENKERTHAKNMPDLISAHIAPATPPCVDPYKALLKLADQMRTLKKRYKGRPIPHDFASLLTLFERAVTRVESQRPHGTWEEKTALVEQYVGEHYQKAYSIWNEWLQREAEMALRLHIELQKIKTETETETELRSLAPPAPAHVTAVTPHFFASGEKRKKSLFLSETLIDSTPTDNPTSLKLKHGPTSEIVGPSKKTKRADTPSPFTIPGSSSAFTKVFSASLT